MTQEEVAQRVGKDRSSITNALRLLKLPLEVQKLVEENKLAMGHARALLSVDSAEQQINFAKEIVAKSLSVRETEQLVKRSHGTSTGAARKTSKVSNTTDDANVLAAEAKLSRKLGAPVKIKIGAAGGTIEIRFSSSDDLARLFDALMQSRL